MTDTPTQSVPAAPKRPILWTNWITLGGLLFVGIGLVLFIAGLVISLTLGQGATIGLIFGIPLLIAGLVLPVIMMRDLFHHNVVNGDCPFCGAPIKTSDATIRLNCPSCKRLIEVRETTLQPGE